MVEFLGLFREFTPGAYGIWALVIMGFLYGMREWRETRKLSLEDRLARRDGYAKQVSDLTVENRELRDEIAAVRASHEEYRQLCHQETDQLRAQVYRLEADINGVLRGLTLAQIHAIRQLPPGTVSEEALAAADRAEKFLMERG